MNVNKTGMGREQWVSVHKYIITQALKDSAGIINSFQPGIEIKYYSMKKKPINYSILKTTDFSAAVQLKQNMGHVPKLPD